jgi:hypothetical protein
MLQLAYQFSKSSFSHSILLAVFFQTEVHASGARSKHIPITMHGAPAVKSRPHFNLFSKPGAPLHTGKPASHHGLN